MKYMYANKPNQYSCLVEKSVVLSDVSDSTTGLTITKQKASDAINLYSSLKTSS
ncbi:MAG: hypothetical protein ACMG6E_01405 [Candidatus Roizmanbacteria bacterium]